MSLMKERFRHAYWRALLLLGSLSALAWLLSAGRRWY